MCADETNENKRDSLYSQIHRQIQRHRSQKLNLEMELLLRTKKVKTSICVYKNMNEWSLDWQKKMSFLITWFMFLVFVTLSATSHDCVKLSFLQISGKDFMYLI